MQKAAMQPVNKGRILFAEDVVAIYFTRQGKPFRSRAWVLAHFAPEHKRRLGRNPFWYSTEADAWMDDLPHWNRAA